MANEVTDVKIRILYADAGETRVDQVFVCDGIRANPGGTTPTTDPREMTIVPKTEGFMGQDDKIILSAKPTSTTNFDTNSEMEIPVMVQNVKTGVVRADFLNRSDFFSSDQGMTVNVWNQIGEYTVGAQENVKLGQDIPENSKLRVVVRSA